MLDKRGYLQSIAIFMSCLIISIPLYSTSVFAGLDYVGAKGSAGIDNYIKGDDYIDFTVIASIDGDAEITNDQVWYGVTSMFDSPCTETFYGDYQCTLTWPSSGTYSWTPGSVPYTINLKDDTGSVVDSSSSTLYVDNLAPSVTSISTAPTTSRGDITLSYEVKDYAYTSGDTSKCSGLKKIEFRKDSISGTLWKTENLDTAGCTSSGSYAYTYSGSDGLIRICAVVYDKFDQSSTDEVCGEFTLDTTPPEINSIDIVDSTGKSILYSGSGAITAYAKANITTADLDASSITADLSSLGGGTEESPTTASIGDYTIATWTVSMSAGTTTISIEVNASDAVLNNASRTFTKTLTADTTAPVVTSLQTNKVHDSKSYAKATGNNFTAQITEEGAGLNTGDVKLHIGTAATIPANPCVGSASVWTCYWNNTAVSGSGIVEAYIGTDTKDILGNAVTGKFSINLTMDNTAPVVNSIKVEDSPTPGYIATGDTLTVAVNVSDADAPVVYGYGYLSEAISSMVNSYVSCTKQDNYFICQWSGVVDSGRKESAALNFKIYDFVGNYIEASTTRSIYGAEEVAPDFYKLSLGARIEPIDKQVAEHLVVQNYYQIVPFTLKHNTTCSSVEIINAKLTGSGCADGSYVNYNKATDNKDYNGFFQFAIAKSAIKSAVSGGSITIGADNSCYLEFNVVCDDVVYSTAEKEQIYFNIAIVDTEAPDESLVDDIEKLKHSAESDLAKFIETLDKIVVILQNLCKIKFMFTLVFQTFDYIGKIYSALMGTPWTYSAGLAGEKKTTQAKGSMSEMWKVTIKPIVDKACALVMCTNKGDTEFMGTAFQSFLHGNFCDWLREWLITSLGDYGPWLYGEDVFPSTLELAKKSWIFSFGCRCIPGMIYNAKKLQEMKCWKAYCFQKMVPAGLPVDECRKQHKYQTCVYWWGQLGAFLDMFAAPLNKLMEMLANPIASGWTIGKWALKRNCNLQGFACTTAADCEVVWNTACTWYSVMIVLENIAQVAQFIDTWDQMEWEPTMNFCDELD